MRTPFQKRPPWASAAPLNDGDFGWYWRPLLPARQKG